MEFLGFDGSVEGALELYRFFLDNILKERRSDLEECGVSGFDKYTLRLRQN